MFGLLVIFILLIWGAFLCPPIYLQLESQCQELHSEQHVTKVENVKLKQTNDELAQDLEHTTQELVLAQEQLSLLQEQSTRLHEEKEMWVMADLSLSGEYYTCIYNRLIYKILINAHFV